MCQKHLRLRASKACISISCPHLSSCRVARSSLPNTPACRAGRIGCSLGLPVAPTMPASFFRSQPDAWSKSARKLRYNWASVISAHHESLERHDVSSNHHPALVEIRDVLRLLFDCHLGRCRKLQHRRILTFTERGQEDGLPIGKLKRIVMSATLVHVHSPENCRPVRRFFSSPPK